MPITRLTKVAVIALFLGESIGLVEANQASVTTLTQNQLTLEALQRSEGIYDRVVQKLQMKEEAQNKFVSEQVSQQLLAQTQEQLNTQREALLNSPYPSSLEGDVQDVQQALKEINVNGKKTTQKKLSYEEQIDQIAKQQEQENKQYASGDDFQGFGSLTEMIKNKDSIAEDQAQQLQEQERKKKEEEEKKKQVLEKAKAKMKEHLDKDVQKRKAEEAKKKKVVAKPRIKDNSFLAISAKKNNKKTIMTAKKVLKKVLAKKNVKPIVPIKKTISKQTLAQKLAAKLSSKSSAKPKTKSLLPPPAPFVDNVLVDTSDEVQQKDQNKTKLYDGSVNQVIDELQKEQESKIAEKKFQESLPPEQKKPKEEEESGGYLSNFRKKFSNLKENEESDNQQVQVSSQVDSEVVTATESQKKAHKGIMERFNDKINEDVADQEKTQDIINTVQRQITKPKQTLIERESERLIREQDEELANDEELITTQQQQNES